MKLLDGIDKVRQALLTGGLKAVERVLGSAHELGTPLAHAPARPDPVILVGGYANFDASWQAWARSLARDGIPAYPVTVPGNATGDLEAGARYLAEQVERVRRETGAARVDIVGFSAGGIIVRQFAKYHAARDSIDAVVTLATPNNGIGISGPLGAVAGALLDPLYRVFGGAAAPQMRRGSAFLARLNAASTGDAAGTVRYASVFSAIMDGAVTSASARLDHGLNIPIGKEPNVVKLPMGPDHYMILHRSNAAYDAARAVLLGLV
jgi:triacylglycerol esterase/lipase EstA (alpha/beta hydrolase family)